MKKLLLAALVGLVGALSASACPVNEEIIKLRPARTTLTGKLVCKIELSGDMFSSPQAVEVWELHVGDKVYNLDLPDALFAQARKLDGKQVIVSGEMLHRRLMKVEKLDRVVAELLEDELKDKYWIGPLLPTERDFLKTPQLTTTDLFGTLVFDAEGGITLTADDGKVFRVLVLCGNDDALLKKARRLQTWRFGVQARGVVAGDVLILTDVWPAEPRGPK
jgi:hypothetical protein